MEMLVKPLNSRALVRHAIVLGGAPRSQLWAGRPLNQAGTVVAAVRSGTPCKAE
jgi:hypothetical protein